MPKLNPFSKENFSKNSAYRKYLDGVEERSHCPHAHYVIRCSHCNQILGSEKVGNCSLIITNKTSPMENTEETKVGPEVTEEETEATEQTDAQ
jgi:hypothetical protein